MPQEFTQWNVSDVILNLYKATSFLGEGGFGKVYKARHIGWNSDLAVKIPNPEIVEAAGGINKFEREVKSWVDLGLHPHVVSCYYVRRYEGSPLVFAEYVAAGSLADWVRSRQLYVGGEIEALKRILDIAIQIAWGLHYAHQQGIIHQNVKPANVMLTEDGVAKVTDFGLASPSTMAVIFEGDGSNSGQGLVEDDDRTLMISGGGFWTQAYRSPEQACDEHLTRRSDLWSWGLCVLEMFQGDRTWLDGAAATHALAHYLQAQREDTQMLSMPMLVSRVLWRCFQNDPDSRFHDLLEVANQFKEIYQQIDGNIYPRNEPLTGITADSLNNQAASLLDLGLLEEALQLWEQALKLQPHHPESIYNRGLILWRTGRVPDDWQLVRELKEAQESGALDWLVSYLLSGVHLERGDCASAIAALKSIKGLWAELEEVQTALAMALERLPHSSRLLHTFVGHTWGVSSISMSEDERYILSGSHDRTLKMWEAQTGRCLRTFEGHTWGVYAVGLSADSLYAASVGGDYTLKLWEVASERCVHTVEGHIWDLKTVCLSKDTQVVLSVSGDNSLNLWEVATGILIRTFISGDIGVKAVSLSADNLFALSGTDSGTIALWDVSTGELIRTFEGHALPVKSVCFSEDAEFVLSGSEDKTIKLWQVSTGECLRTLEGHTGKVNSVSLSKDVQLALSGSDDNTLKLWDLAGVRCLRTFNEVENEPYLIVHLSEDGRKALSVSGANPLIASNLTLWTINKNSNNYVAPGRLSVADRKAETAISRGLTYEWELDAAMSALGLKDYATAATHIRKARTQPGYSRRIEAVKSWTDLYIRLRRKAFRDCWESVTFIGHKDEVNAVCISIDGRFVLSASSDKSLKLWDAHASRCIRTFEGHIYDVYSVCLSVDNQFALSGSDDKTVKLWDVATGECIRTFEGQAVVFSICISKDARFCLSGNGDGTLRLWEIATGRCLRTFIGHTVVQSVCLSADSRYALSGSYDNTLKLWDVTTGQCIRTFTGHTKEVKSVCLSENGQLGLSGSGTEIKLWDISTGECIRTFVGHSARINSVSFSLDGRFALSGSDDNTTRLWDVSSGRCLRTVEGHTSRVNCVCMSVDARFFVSASKDKTLKLWILDWELETRQSAEWDASASPYLENFLTQHSPYIAKLSVDRSPTDEEITLALTRSGTPSWTEDDLKNLLYTLGCAGYGWLTLRDVKHHLEVMAGMSPEPEVIPDNTQISSKVVLTVTSGSLQGQKFVFKERTTCIIGRASDCYPKLPNDAAHSTISRYHCLLDINPPEIRVRDFGSKNGTYVNGKKIGQRSPEQFPEDNPPVDNFPEHDLQSGDEIKLGNTVFRASIEAGSVDESFQTATWEITIPPTDAKEIIPRLVEQARAGDPNLTAIRDYTILKLQGVSTFGAVYLARHHSTDEVVALKVMLPQIVPSQSSIEMFLREAANAKTLQHPNIVKLRDYGYDRGSFFLVLEYCDSGNAIDLINQRGGRLSIDEAVSIILQVTAGLKYAHHAEIPYAKRSNGTLGKGRGLIHRDLKPSNIFFSNVNNSRIAKIGDYGLARSFDLAGLSGQTMSGTKAGTPFFMPRQQVINFKYSKPSLDIWATAACLYYMLTGAYPRNFIDSDPFLTVLQTNPVPIRQQNADIPLRLAEVIDQALVDKPEIHFKDAVTFNAVLLSVL